MAEESETRPSNFSSQADSVEGAPMFCPPLYRQRYMAVLKIIEEMSVNKVIDFGCAECKFLPLLRRLKTLEETVGVDIDRNVLEAKKFAIKPLPAEYLGYRERSLRIRLYEGSLAEHDPRMEGFDCVTMIEVVEHLFDDVLSAFPSVIFEKIRPRIVIMTTPNAEYNVVFPNFTGMRHEDHKFEWTRQEFQNWANNICSQYGYSVEFSGVGEPPPEKEDVGFCSQIATFTHTKFQEQENLQSNIPEEDSLTGPYELVAEAILPCKSKPVPEVALALEIDYYIRKNVIAEREKVHQLWEETEYTEDDDGTNFILKLEDLLKYKGIEEKCSNVVELREAVREKSYNLSADGEGIILSLEDDYESDEYQDEDDPDDFYSYNDDYNEIQETSGASCAKESECNQEDENWDNDCDSENKLTAEINNVISFDEMWADVDTDERTCLRYQGRGNNDFIANFVPEEYGIDPRMVYVPSVLHAPSMPPRIQSKESEEGQFTDDSDSASVDFKEEPIKVIVRGNLPSQRTVVKDFCVELGQFEDIGDNNHTDHIIGATDKDQER